MARFDLVGAVAVGGAIGCVARYLIGAAIGARLNTTFPVGTMAINISGCFAIGAFMYMALNLPQVGPVGRAFLTTGLCGGFTTFSTFSWEVLTAVEEGELVRAAFYLGGSITLGLIAVWLGREAAGVAFNAMRGARA